jgi:pimeloyl-ACP methyl ester carboxylesterase
MMTPEHARTRDGRELYLERHGTGSPTVVFESGMAMSRSGWGAVAPIVAAHTTAVVYDRSGLGRSPHDPAPRGLSRLTDDLIDVLAHLGDGPFVLVGHSWGGPIVRSAAATAPGLVAGLVLVDQTDEGCEMFFSRAWERQVRMLGPILPAVARLGLLRLGVSGIAARLPEPARSAMRAEDGTVAAARTQRAEMTASLADLRRLRDEPLTMPDVPVTLVSGLRASWFEGRSRKGLLDAHRARAAALPQGRHVGAARSGHYVPFVEPELVAEEILRIVDAVRPKPSAA